MNIFIKKLICFIYVKLDILITLDIINKDKFIYSFYIKLRWCETNIIIF